MTYLHITAHIHLASIPARKKAGSEDGQDNLNSDGPRPTIKIITTYEKEEIVPLVTGLNIKDLCLRVIKKL